MSTGSTRALPDDARQEANFDAAESTGLFIGVQVCDEPELTPVDYAVDDAVDLAHVFVFELGLIQPAKAVLALAGEPLKASSRQALERLLAAGAAQLPATAASIYRQLPQMALKGGRRGLCVLSFAGHGFVDAAGDLLVTRDFVVRQPAATGLRFASLMNEIQLSLAPRRLVLVDACRTRLKSARSPADSEAGADSLGQAILRTKGAAILAATTLGGTSYDDPDRRNGVFTGNLIDILRGDVLTESPDPFLTIGNLAATLDDRVRNWVLFHRKDHAGKFLGISCALDPPSMRHLPLAVDPKRFQQSRELRERCRRALVKLQGALEPPLTGALYDEVRIELMKAAPAPQTERLLEGIARLDGSLHAREALLALHEKNRRAPSGSPAARTGRGRAILKAGVALASAIVVVATLYETIGPLPPPETGEARMPAQQTASADHTEKLQGPAAQVVAEELEAKTEASAAPPQAVPEQEPEKGRSRPAVLFQATQPHGWLRQGKPEHIPELAASIAANFTSELGIDIATVVWAPQGLPLVKKPVYQSGADLSFESARGKVRVQVLNIDWKRQELAWSASIEAPLFECSTKTESFDRGPAQYWNSPGGRFGIENGAFHIELAVGIGWDKRCIDCRVAAETYRVAAAVVGDPNAASWGLYLLDMSEVREEMYTLELETRKIATIKHYVPGRNPATLWSGALETGGKLRLALEAKEGTLSAWADGRRLGEVSFDRKSIPKVPLGAGFIVAPGNQVPVSVAFDDYELTTCVFKENRG